jgi:speckle-type POZ protein
MKHTFSLASDNWGFIKLGVSKSCQISSYPRCTQDVETSSVTVLLPNLQKDFENMLNDGEGVDRTFDVRSQLVRSHICVLAFCSSIFNAKIFGPMKEKATHRKNIDDIEPLIFEVLIHFTYTYSLLGNYKDVKVVTMHHLLIVADRYEVNMLRLLCESKLSEEIDV